LSATRIEREESWRKGGKKEEEIIVQNQGRAMLCWSLVANVNGAMSALEGGGQSEWRREGRKPIWTPTRAFVRIRVTVVLQLSDELELLSTFARRKVLSAIDALKALLDFATFLDDQFVD
jgi:hypothetical protein